MVVYELSWVTRKRSQQLIQQQSMHTRLSTHGAEAHSGCSAWSAIGIEPLTPNKKLADTGVLQIASVAGSEVSWTCCSMVPSSNRRFGAYYVMMLRQHDAGSNACTHRESSLSSYLRVLDDEVLRAAQQGLNNLQQHVSINVVKGP